jgi:hypothetical protein
MAAEFNRSSMEQYIRLIFKLPIAYNIIEYISGHLIENS